MQIMNLPENYIPILIQAAVGIGFVALCILGSHYLGPRQKKTTKAKKNTSSKSPATGASSAVLAGGVAAAGAGIAVLAAMKKKEND